MMKDMRRWMHASVALYLKSVAVLHGIPALCEGLDERTTAFQEAPDRMEIRMNGPYTTRLPGITEARVTVNVLFTSNFGSNQKNAFSLDNAMGATHQAMDLGIPLFRTGAATDDRVQIGCLQVIKDVKVFDFGQLDAITRTRQGMVTASYQFDFDY